MPTDRVVGAFEPRGDRPGHGRHVAGLNRRHHQAVGSEAGALPGHRLVSTGSLQIAQRARGHQGVPGDQGGHRDVVDQRVQHVAALPQLGSDGVGGRPETAHRRSADKAGDAVQRWIGAQFLDYPRPHLDRGGQTDPPQLAVGAIGCRPQVPGRSPQVDRVRCAVAAGHIDRAGAPHRAWPPSRSLLRRLVHTVQRVQRELWRTEIHCHPTPHLETNNRCWQLWLSTG